LGIDAGLQALGGGAVAFAAVLVVVLAGRGAMGYGDAKVACICGAVVGLANVLVFFVATFAAGGAFAALAMTVGRRGRKDSVAFTPFLFVGVVAALLLGGEGVYALRGG
jgi:prepilin signal peptidase PulO-like enzyme (type II secretory pathway)